MRNRLLELIQEKQRRDLRLISQREVARELGVEVNTVKAWIRQDVGRYDERLIEAMCKYFNLTEPNQLFYFEETNEPTG